MIRTARAGDRESIYDVCLRTADAGEDATALYTDPLLPGHVWAGAYLVLEPDHAFVIDDGERAIGYALGALDSRIFEAESERVWWPPLRERYAPGGEARSTHERITRWLIHHPPRADEAIVERYPSHLHIDLLPSAQRRGDGRRLMDRLLDSLRAAGSPGVHLGVAPSNLRALGFYRALGFTELTGDEQRVVFVTDLR